ncbi:hypothetical protein PDJAM_G00121520 [Pangasius djambal]|uniref:Uncharacterized protein n=1 Tax=Pangasius djambal TaxID=1691987 RepID=A0ACC5Z9L1_9TELE|nr:hypothetical protein [Pangasius djambal]
MSRTFRFYPKQEKYNLHNFSQLHKNSVKAGEGNTLLLTLLWCLDFSALDSDLELDEAPRRRKASSLSRNKKEKKEKKKESRKEGRGIT